MKRTKPILVILFLLTLCLLVCSCSAGSAASDMDFGNAISPEYEYDYNYGVSKEEYYESPVENAGGATADSSAYAEKIIHNVTMISETREFDRALTELRQAVAGLGGYEQSVNTTGKSYHSNDRYCRTARMVLRIPADALSEFLGAVGNLVNVTSQSMNSTNVTAEYYDIKSRIGVLESEKAAYEEMLKKSSDVNHLLQIKDRLYNVIEEIEAYQTQIRLYDNKVAYSTVTVTLDEVIEYTKVTTPKDTFGSRIAKAFTESWKDFAEGFQSFTVWLVRSIPTLLVIGILLSVSIVIALRATHRKKQKKAQQEQTEK